MNTLPRNRTSDLVVQELEEETLIYDLKSNKAFCLNETSSLVWKHCDGKTAPQVLIEKYNLTTELIRIALNNFQENNLLSDEIKGLLPEERIERRLFMVKAASTAAVAIPLISAVVAPRAIAAQSTCLVDGTPIDISPQPDAPTCFAGLTAFAAANCCSGIGGGFNFVVTGSCTTVCFTPPTP